MSELDTLLSTLVDMMREENVIAVLIVLVCLCLIGVMLYLVILIVDVVGTEKVRKSGRVTKKLKTPRRSKVTYLYVNNAAVPTVEYEPEKYELFVLVDEEIVVCECDESKYASVREEDSIEIVVRRGRLTRDLYPVEIE